MRAFLALPVALVVAIALAVPLRAQDQPTLQLYGGLGLDVIRIRDGSRYTPAPVVQLGMVRQLGASRFGARFDATYTRTDGGSTILGASVGLTSDLGSGGWRPYVLGGVGMYRLAAAIQPAAAGGRRWTAGALIGGLGLRRAIGRAQVFGELRYHDMNNGKGFWAHQLPFTFGIRF
jgi:hypothetical protein